MRSRFVAVAVSVTLAVALLGCTAPDPAPSTGGGTSPSGSPSASAETDVDYSEISVYRPVALGTTWTYRADYYGFNGVGVVIITETVAELTPGDDGVEVLIERTFHHEDGSFPDSEDTLEFTFRDDGSASFPFLSNPPDSGVLAGQYSVTVTEGELAWPSVSDFDAAAGVDSTVAATLSNGSLSFEETVAVTVVGQGSEEVSVPAGVYPARIVRQDILTTVTDRGSFPSSVTTWFAEGVGPVRQIVVDEIFGSESVTVELVEYVVGP